jgi:hypothetical protein
MGKRSAVMMVILLAAPVVLGLLAFFLLPLLLN